MIEIISTEIYKIKGKGCFDMLRQPLIFFENLSS